MNNRKLTRLEIWLKGENSFKIKFFVIFVLIYLIIMFLKDVIPYGLDKDAEMEDIKIKQYQESIK